MKAKFILLGIRHNVKYYAAIFIVVALLLFTLLCSFGIRENVLAAQEETLSKYTVVAITTKGEYLSSYPQIILHFDETWDADVLRSRPLIDSDFIMDYALDEHVIDYYAFVETGIRANYVVPVSYGYNPGETIMEVFVTRYSDISKSVLFMTGDRVITEGRFAQSELECNISEELAALNGLTIGSIIEMTKWDGILAEWLECEVVGIFSESRFGYVSELDLVNYYPNADGYSYTFPGHPYLAANNILLFANEETFYTNTVHGRFDYGYDFAVFYFQDEKDMAAFLSTYSDILPEQFVMLDTMDVTVYMRSVLDRTDDSFTQLLVIICAISVLFCALLLIGALKNRTYDIGVLRARGMTKTKIAFSLTSEFFIVTFASFIAAFVLYITAFAPVASAMYSSQNRIVRNEPFWFNYPAISVVSAGSEYEFAVSVYPTALLYGIVIIAVFTLVVGFASIFFISRHEPMKTMTRY